MTVHLKLIGDGVFGTITIGALINALPQVTAVLAFTWWCIRIYETRTVQGWLARIKNKSMENKMNDNRLDHTDQSTDC